MHEEVKEITVGIEGVAGVVEEEEREERVASISGLPFVACCSTMPNLSTPGTYRNAHNTS